ncbi:MAG TPA: VanW family protein [Patescibacteria group bacterium]|nr:VanW family protein [Patescibacteria group bacterium]
MQLTSATPPNQPTTKKPDLARRLSYFLAAPVTAAVMICLTLALVVTIYQQQHFDRIFTGVTAWGIDLSSMGIAEAERELLAAFPYTNEGQFRLIDPAVDEQWTLSPAELGFTLDAKATIATAYSIGRQGGPFQRLKQQYDSWYYGHQVSPVMVLNEGRLDEAVTQIALEIARPAVDASLGFDGTEVTFTSAQVGRSLDLADTKARLLATLDDLNQGQIELLVHETLPRIGDTSQAAQEIRQIMGEPISFYLQEPLDGVDLERVTVPTEEVIGWIRVRTAGDDQGGMATEVFLDENALRAWLAPYEELLSREPVNARFYFDDNTKELVLVEPHVNGRALDVEATVEQFLKQVKTPNRSMPFALKEIVPTVHSGATTEDLGITELVSESTTWFFGSSNERMHNIARSASNFYGIVIAPGDEFTFNHFLGEVSAEQGYETGLIIFGGRTIEGVGGGVCQVSTTLFQAAFWAGYPIVERWEHGYQVGYYDDGEGPGMDATVYSPLVDLRFINDTPYHLLIENYYNEANSSLTFKFYSTGLGRTVVKDGPSIANVVPAKPDIWELNEDLEAGEIEQVDWAVEGADVTIGRSVFNTGGDLIRQDSFISNYVPWQNIYQYGPGTILPTPEEPQAEEVSG